jgi:hypothetical protein
MINLLELDGRGLEKGCETYLYFEITIAATCQKNSIRQQIWHQQSMWREAPGQKNTPPMKMAGKTESKNKNKTTTKKKKKNQYQQSPVRGGGAASRKHQLV